MNLLIMDETLRDGEQQVGVNFKPSVKVQLANEILESGIDMLGVMPVVSQYESDISKTLVNQFVEKVFASTLMSKESVDFSRSLGFKTIVLFSSMSDKLLANKRLTRKENIENAIKVVGYAKAKGLQVYFAGEDAIRADRIYLMNFIKSIENSIQGFIICDTVGTLEPETVKDFIKEVKTSVICKIGVHFHNDKGFAVENSVIAIKAGAEILSGTITGIGERAGNADVIAVLEQLKNDGIVSKKIDYNKLRGVAKDVAILGGSKPAKPFSKEAFYHESGIHVNALKSDPLSYNCFDPHIFHQENTYFFGKFAGVSNYELIFGEKYNKAQLVEIRDYIKTKAYRENKSFSKEDVLEFENNGLFDSIISKCNKGE